MRNRNVTLVLADQKFSAITDSAQEAVLRTFQTSQKIYRSFSSLGYFRKSCESTWRTCINLYCVTLTYVRLRNGHMTHEKGLLKSNMRSDLRKRSQLFSFINEQLASVKRDLKHTL